MDPIAVEQVGVETDLLEGDEGLVLPAHDLDSLVVVPFKVDTGPFHLDLHIPVARIAVLAAETDRPLLPAVDHQIFRHDDPLLVDHALLQLFGGRGAQQDRAALEVRVGGDLHQRVRGRLIHHEAAGKDFHILFVEGHLHVLKVHASPRGHPDACAGAVRVEAALVADQSRPEQKDVAAVTMGGNRGLVHHVAVGVAVADLKEKAL